LICKVRQEAELAGRAGPPEIAGVALGRLWVPLYPDGAYSPPTLGFPRLACEIMRARQAGAEGLPLPATANGLLILVYGILPRLRRTNLNRKFS
jgi:hypothetical protein